MPVIFLGIALSAPTTAYDSGDRTGSITVTSNITPDGGTINNLVDGGTTANSTDAIDMPGTGSTPIPTDTYVKFDFGVGVKKYIDEIRLRFSTGANMGAWVVQCSNDDVSYTTVANYTWNSDDLTIPCTNVDPEGFRYWKLAKNGAGTNYTNNWWTEVNFKIAAGAI